MNHVLVFPANGPGAVDICSSLKTNLHFNVFGAVGRSDHAEMHFPKGQYIVDDDLFLDKEEFLSRFNSLLAHWRISYIIPTHDTVARYLIEHQANLEAEVVCSPLETARIAENKLLQYEHLRKKSYYPTVYEDKNVCFPAFIKPFVTAGGKGAKKVENQFELDAIRHEKSDYLISEFLPGEEYTVDCFTDRKRHLLFSGARTRERITSGITYYSKGIEMTDEIRLIAEDLNDTFIFRGAWFFQMKRASDGRLKLMEFSVRHAGTMNYYRQLGVNFTLLSLFDWMDYPVEIIKNNFDLHLTRGTETLYKTALCYDTVYLDYDDTLIVNHLVNTRMIQFVYQARNNKKKVVLLTKHDGDLEESLKEYGISKSLFDEVICVGTNEKKEDFITEQHSIFIDNYFPDRMRVSKKCGIPVFDVDAVECLINANE